MFRSTVRKVMWVGRATVFLVGLAVILALVVGVASTAFGANGGNFILGQTNVATLVTRLAGPDGVDGTMFTVKNNNAGNDDTALSLKVDSGEPPMMVDSKEKVPDLNADQVDGQGAETLLPGGELPSGRTLRGTYGIYDVAEAIDPDGPSGPDDPLAQITWASDSISFGYRLPSAPSVELIKAGASSTQNCPGTADSPEAGPGFLCIYEKESENLFEGIENPAISHVTRTGAILVAKNKINSIRVFYKTNGTWAVTAP